MSRSLTGFKEAVLSTNNILGSVRKSCKRKVNLVDSYKSSSSKSGKPSGRNCLKNERDESNELHGIESGSFLWPQPTQDENREMLNANNYFGFRFKLNRCCIC